MKTGNVIDLITYRDQHNSNTNSISDELKSAIQHLIYRLRELGPISQS